MDTSTHVVLATTHVAGQEVNFHRPSIGQLSEIIPLIAPFLSDLLQGETSLDLSALLHRGDDLSRAVSLATGTPEAWVKDLQFDDFLVLFIALLGAYGNLMRKLTIHFPDPPRGPAQTAKLEG